MKRFLTGILAASMIAGLAGCGSDTADAGSSTSASPAASAAGSVELTVCTTFAGEDGNAQNFRNAVSAWESETGNTVTDTSATSDETFKTRVVTDFETGSEPDVLFFFNGSDSNDFVKAGKVVSIDDIRAEYPDYASNMNDDLIAASPADGKKYAVPVNGYWEALFVNTKILEDAGVEVPGADTTWEEFLDDCEKIKNAGYTPIAAALGNIPHYWWEYSIFNHESPENHLEIPQSADDEIGQDGKAAFLLDGSWKVGGIISACQSDPEDETTLDQDKLDQFSVTYVPGNGDRKATDLIGGLSMGYYITKKAWDDPAKRDAAVSFVEYMTSDDVVPVFAQHTATALKNAPKTDLSNFKSLQVKAMDMMSGVTSLTGAVQDLFNGDCRVSTFDGMPEIVTGRKDIAEAVQEGLDTYYAAQ